MSVKLLINNKEFIIKDYDNVTPTLGISFYNYKVFYFDKEIRDELQSYKFKLKVFLKKSKSIKNSTEENKKLFFDEIFGRNTTNHIEFLEFIHTCRLEDYIVKTKSPKNNKKYLKINIDETFNYEKLINEVCPEELKFVVNRILRAEEGIVPNRIIYYGTHQLYVGDNQEFLEFDESACSWGGPFVHSQSGKEGACIDIKTTSTGLGDYPILDVSTDFNYSNIPDYLKEIIFENTIKTDPDFQNKYKEYLPLTKNYCNNILYTWLNTLTKEEKRTWFYSLSAKDKHEIAKNYYNTSLYEERLEIALPYRIYMYGNDDCSYTKWFASMEDVEKELIYLRKMQPLNMEKDIYTRGYIFTN